MMINVPRFYIRDVADMTIATLDEGDYFDDNLTRYLSGKASILSFSIYKQEGDYELFTTGKKLSFRFEDEDYWMNIMSVEQDETTLSITAVSLNLELNNEDAPPFKAGRSMSFKEYFDIINTERTFELGLNEVSDKRIQHEWTGTSTKLARLFSLANVFDAEVEFNTELNKDGSLKRIVANVYRAHSDQYQGLGTNRTNETFRFGEDIKTVRKTEDSMELYTAIRPKGKDGLGINGVEHEVFDEDGKLLYCTYKTSRSGFGDTSLLYAPQSRVIFPSTIIANGDQWTVHDTDELEYSNAEALYGYALSELKKNCVPQTTWEIEGYIDARIGDTVRIANDGYKPELFLEARVAEQSISFNNPTKSQTTFSNVEELASQISQDLIARMQALIEANKKYEYQIISDNGIVFKNNKGETTLTARVLDGVENITDSLKIQWTKDGKVIATTPGITVKATDIDGKAVYRFEAIDSTGAVKGGYEVTVTDVDDGYSPKVTINDDTSITIEDKTSVQQTPPLQGDDGFSPTIKENPDGSLTITDIDGTYTTPPYLKKEDMDAVKVEIEEAIKAVDDEVTKQEDAWKAEATKIKDDLKIVISTSDNALTKANAAVDKATQAANQASQAANVSNQAKTDAAKAVADALKAKEDAGKSTEVANQAKEDAGTAITNALQAKTDAKTALTNADSALKDVAGVKTTLNSEITRLDSEISAKVTTTTFDSLKGIVTSQGGQISTLSGQVAIKADKTQVDTLTGRVSTVEGSITTNANAIKLKANQTEVNTLTGKVTSVEGSLSVQAGQITALTTKTNTNTTQIGKLETNYNGLTSTVTKVQSDLAGLDINDRNLLPNSRLETEATGWTYDSSSKIEFAGGDGYKYVKFTKLSASTRSIFGSRHVILADFNLKVGDTLTLSMNQFNTTGITTNSNLFVRCYDASNGITGDICVSNISSNLGMKRIFTTGKIPANTIKMAACVALATINSVVRFNNIKIQKGNKATSWTAAFEDYATVNQYSELKQTLTEVSATVTNNKKDADGKITNVQGQITTNANAIKLKANQTQVDTISGKVTSVEGSLSVQAGQITALTTKTNTNTTQIGKLETNYNGLTSTVTKVQTDLAGLTIGATNLVGNGNASNGVNSWGGNGSFAVTQHNFYELGRSNAFVLQTTGTAEVTRSSNWFNLKPNAKYTLRFVGFAASNVSNMDVWLLTRNKANDTGSFDRAFALVKDRRLSPGGAEVVTVTVTTNALDASGQIRFDNNGSNNGAMASLFFIEVVFVEGNKAPQGWIPSINDVTTTSQFSALTQRVDSINATVATKANQADLTILSNQITSVVKEVATKVTDKQFTTNNSSSTFAGQWTKFAETTISKQYVDAQVGFDVIASGNGQARPDAGRFYIRHKQQGAMGTATVCELVLTDSSYLNKDDLKAVVTSNTTTGVAVAYYIRIRQTWTSFKMTPFNSSGYIAYFGTQPFVTAVPSGSQTFYGKEGGSMAGLTTAMTQITQLSDQIDLRVVKSQIVAQLNLSSEGVYIKGALIRLDGAVVMQDAFANTLYANTAFITKFNAQTVNAITVNATTVRAKLLTANVVTAAMIKSDQALFDKVFASSAYFEQIASNTAFFKKLQANTFTAVNINGGTIDGATIRSSPTAGSVANRITISRGQVSGNDPSGFESVSLGSQQLVFFSYNADHSRLTNRFWMDSTGITNNNTTWGMRRLQFAEEGLTIRADLNNTGNNRNSGIELYGDHSYIDFHDAIGDTKDNATRMIQFPNGGQFQIEQKTNAEFHIVSNANIVLRGPAGILVRNKANTAWATAHAGAFSQASSKTIKYDISEMEDGYLDQLKSVSFKGYKQVGTGDYQLGVILEETTDLPFTGETGVDLYSYATFLGKSLQEETKLRESDVGKLSARLTVDELKIRDLEKRITELEDKLAS